MIERASWEEGIANIKFLRQERDWETRGAETMPGELKVVNWGRNEQEM